MIRLSSPIPVLRIFDEAKAREFYVDWLGFTVDWEHRFGDNFPIYLQMSRGHCVIHLSEHHGDATPGAHLRVDCDDIDGFVSELSAKDYKYAKPGEPEEKPWGTREITLTDPFSNRLTFSGPPA